MAERVRRWLYMAALSLNVSAVSEAHADTTLFSGKGVHITGALDIGGDAFYFPNANFGTGSYAPRKSGGYGRTGNVGYGELYGQPMIAGTWQTPWGFSVFGLASAVGSTTLGDGDAESVSQTSGTPRAVTLEDANLGVRIPLPGKRRLIVEGGRQKFQIDDGFLVGKGAYSSGDRGAWWYAPRFAFSGPGVVKYEGQSLRGDVFVLENNSNNRQTHGNDKPETKFVGFDVTLFRSKPGGDGGSTYGDRAVYVTLTYFHVREADIGAAYDYTNRADRQGMNVTALSWGGTPFAMKRHPFTKNISFYGNFVSEQNSHSGNGYKGVSAYAVYVEPGYTFSDLPWHPHVFYRYTRFSGNRNPYARTKHNYDTFYLYDGARYTYGGYWPGEIVGNNLSPLSNMEIHQFDLTGVPPVHLLKPDDELKLGVHFYDLSYIHPTGEGLPAGTKRHMSDEVNLSAEYAFDANTSGAIAGGAAFSGPAGRALVKSGVPAGETMPRVHGTSGVMEIYFYKHF